MDVCLCLILAVLVSSTSATPSDRFNNANVREVIEEPDNPLEEDDVLEPDFLHNNLDDKNSSEDADDVSPNDILPPPPENKDLGSPGDIEQPKGPLRNNRQNENLNGLRKVGDRPLPPNLSSLLNDIFNEPTRDPEITQNKPSKPPAKPLWHSLNRQPGNTAPLTSEGGPQNEQSNPPQNNERPYHHILRSIAPRVRGKAVFAPARDLPPEELHSLIPQKELSRHIANGKIPIFPVKRQNNGSPSRNPKKTVVVPVMLAFDMYDHENHNLPPGTLPPGMVLPPGVHPFFKKHPPSTGPMGLPENLPAPDSEKRPETLASEPPLPSTSQNSPNNGPVNPLPRRPSETRPRSSRPSRTNPSLPNPNGDPSSLNPGNGMTAPGATNKPIPANAPTLERPNNRPANSPDRTPRPLNDPAIQDDPTVTDNIPDSQISPDQPGLNPFGQNSEPLLSAEDPQENQPLLPTEEDDPNQPSPSNPSPSPFENFPLSSDTPNGPPDFADPSSRNIQNGPTGPSAPNNPRRLNPINQNRPSVQPPLPAPQDDPNPVLRPNQPSSSNIPNESQGPRGLNPFNRNPTGGQPPLPTPLDGPNPPFRPNQPASFPPDFVDPSSRNIQNGPRGPSAPINPRRLNPINQNPPTAQPSLPAPQGVPNPALHPNQPAPLNPDFANPLSSNIRNIPRDPQGALNNPSRLNPINQNPIQDNPTVTDNIPDSQISPDRPGLNPFSQNSDPLLSAEDPLEDQPLLPTVDDPNQPLPFNPNNPSPSPFENFPLSSDIPNGLRGPRAPQNGQLGLNPSNQNPPIQQPFQPAPLGGPNPPFRPNQPASFPPDFVDHSSRNIQNGPRGSSPPNNPRRLNPINQNPPSTQPPLPAPQDVPNPALRPNQPAPLNPEFANPLSSNIPNSPRDPQGALNNPSRLNPINQNPLSAQPPLPAPQDVPNSPLRPNQPSRSNTPNGSQGPRFPHHRPRRLNPYNQNPSGGQPSLSVPQAGPTQQNQPSSLNPDFINPNAFDNLPTPDDISNGPRSPHIPPNGPRGWDPSNRNPLAPQPSNSPVRAGPNPLSRPNRPPSSNPGLMNPSPFETLPTNNNSPNGPRRPRIPQNRPSEWNPSSQNPSAPSPIRGGPNPGIPSENIPRRSSIPVGPRGPGIPPTIPRGLNPSNRNPPAGGHFYPPIQDGPPSFPTEQPSSLNPDFTNVSPFENLPISSDTPNGPQGPYTPNNGPYELNPPNQNPGDQPWLPVNQEISNRALRPDQPLSTDPSTSRDLPNSPRVPPGPRRLNPSNQIPSPQSLPVNTPSKIPKSRRRSTAPDKRPSPDSPKDFPTLENNPESQLRNPNLPQPQNPFDTTPTGISRSSPTLILPQDKTTPQIPSEPPVPVNPNNSPPEQSSEPGNRPNDQTPNIPNIMAPPGAIPSNSNPLGTGSSSGSPVNNQANLPKSPSEKLSPSLLTPPLNPGINNNIDNVPQSPSALPSVPSDPSKLSPPVPNGPTTNPDQSNASPTVPSSLSNPPPITPPGVGESPVSPAPPTQRTLGEPVPTLEAKPDDLTNRPSVIPAAHPSGINSLPTDQETSNAPISVPPLPSLPNAVPQSDTGSQPLPSPVSSPVDPISINQIPKESGISPPLPIPSVPPSLPPNNNNIPSPSATSPSGGATTPPGGQDNPLPVQTTLTPEPHSQSVLPRPDPQGLPAPLSPTQMPTVSSTNNPSSPASIPLNPTPQSPQSNVQENQPNSPASSIPSGTILPAQSTTLPPTSINPGSVSPPFSPTSPILTPQPSNVPTGSVQPTPFGSQPGVTQATNPAPNQPPSSPTSNSDSLPATTVPQIIPVTPSPTTPSAPVTPNPAAGKQALPPQGSPVLTPSPGLPVTSKPTQQTLPETSNVSDPTSTSSESVESTHGPNSNPSIPNIAVDPTKAGSPIAPGLAPIVPLALAPASPAGLPRAAPRSPLGSEGCRCPLLAVPILPVLPVLPVLTGCPTCPGAPNATAPAQVVPLSLPLLGLSASPNYLPYRIPLNFSLVNVTSPKNFTTTPQPSPSPIGLWSYLPLSFGIQSFFQPPNLSQPCKCL